MKTELAILITLGLILFLLAIYSLSSKPSGIKMVIAIEIMVSAANVVFVAMGYLSTPANPVAQSYTLLSLGVGGAIVGFALALLIMWYRQIGTVDTAKEVALRW